MIELVDGETLVFPTDDEEPYTGMLVDKKEE